MNEKFVDEQIKNSQDDRFQLTLSPAPPAKKPRRSTLDDDDDFEFPESPQKISAAHSKIDEMEKNFYREKIFSSNQNGQSGDFFPKSPEIGDVSEDDEDDEYSSLKDLPKKRRRSPWRPNPAPDENFDEFAILDPTEMLNRMEKRAADKTALAKRSSLLRSWIDESDELYEPMLPDCADLLVDKRKLFDEKKADEAIAKILEHREMAAKSHFIDSMNSLSKIEQIFRGFRS